MVNTADRICNLLEWDEPGEWIPCPLWPPDIFAISAHILKESGLYRKLVTLPDFNKPELPFQRPSWPESVLKAGTEWRELLSEQFEGSYYIPIQPDLSSVTNKEERLGAQQDWEEYEKKYIPDQISKWWQELVELSFHSPLISMDPEEVNEEDQIQLVTALIGLCGAADETFRGFVKRIGDKVQSRFEMMTLDRLALNNNLSLCHSVTTEKLRVLPKCHTPQCGMTLRSISHFLCLLPSIEVEAKWYAPFPFAKPPDKLNILLCPWPTEIKHSDFKTVSSEEHGFKSMPDNYGFFSYLRNPIDGFEERLNGVIERAASYVDRVHGIIFPELSLVESDLETLQKVALKRKLFYCAGVQLEKQNALAMNFYGGSKLQEPGFDDLGWEHTHTIRQSKHHRWYLERSQILQYGLGGFIPTNRSWWEESQIGRRELHFPMFSPWLTMCTLICEDLARQDPVADIIRSVGPNLVVALLMDGPQLRNRWASRYATVLAEDPGCSVLSLTSMGMVELSNSNFDNPSRVVALWKDIEATHELSLPEGMDSIILSLSTHGNREHTADGRLDRSANVLLFSGYQGLNSLE